MNTHARFIAALAKLAGEKRVAFVDDPQWANEGTVRFQPESRFGDLCSVRYDFQARSGLATLEVKGRCSRTFHVRYESGELEGVLAFVASQIPDPQQNVSSEAQTAQSEGTATQQSLSIEERALLMCEQGNVKRANERASTAVKGKRVRLLDHYRDQGYGKEEYLVRGASVETYGVFLLLEGFHVCPALVDVEFI